MVNTLMQKKFTRPHLRKLPDYTIRYKPQTNGDIMKAPQDIVSMLGGTTQTAAVLGVTPQAVSNWLRRGGVPAAYATKLIKAAGEKGVALNYSDLIE